MYQYQPKKNKQMYNNLQEGQRIMIREHRYFLFFFYQPGAGISTCREQMFSPFLSFLTEATGYRERTFINRAQSCSKHRFLLSKQDTVTKNTNLMLVRLSTHLIKLMQKAVFVSVDHAAIYSRLHTFSLSLAHTLIF